MSGRGGGEGLLSIPGRGMSALKKGGSKVKIKTLNLREKVLKTSEIICPCSKIMSLDKIS